MQLFHDRNWEPVWSCYLIQSLTIGTKFPFSSLGSLASKGAVRVLDQARSKTLLNYGLNFVF